MLKEDPPPVDRVAKGIEGGGGGTRRWARLEVLVFGTGLAAGIAAAGAFFAVARTAPDLESVPPGALSTAPVGVLTTVPGLFPGKFAEVGR